MLVDQIMHLIFSQLFNMLSGLTLFWESQHLIVTYEGLQGFLIGRKKQKRILLGLLYGSKAFVHYVNTRENKDLKLCITIWSGITSMK